MEKRQPRLRFPGFEMGLQTTKLDQFTQWSSGGTPSKDKPEYWNGDIPWISASSMRGLIFNDSELKITQEGLKNGSRIALKGSLLLLVRGSMLFNKIPVGLAGVDVAFNQDVKSISVNERIALSEFLLQWFLSKESLILNMVTGTGIGAGKLELADLKGLVIPLPSLPEQTKIASFLSAVDEKLNLLKEKKAALEEYKKGMMQKIFPSAGSGKSPEIRFKDENGKDFPEWEETKLNDFKDLSHGDGDWVLSKDLSLDGKYKLIQLGNIGLGNYIEKELKTISEEKFKEIKGTVLRKGDLLINRMVDNNLYCCILDKEGDYITSVDVCWIRENKIFNNYFLMSTLLHNDNQIKLLNLSSGSGRVRISKSNLFNKFWFFLPCFKEQTKIADFLSAIDEKIDLVAAQIEETLEYKKGLLQQLFC